MNEKIPLFRIFSDEKDVEAVAGVLRRGSYWAEGPEIAEFEKLLAQYVGAEHAVVFNNGTSALHAMLLAYGIGEGDEVIVPSFTFISTSNAPLFVGARPVFADIEPDTMGLDVNDVAGKITERTKAIMPIHYAGHSCKIDEIRQLADERSLMLFEDAAEALGGTFKGRKVGTFGDAGMFSFCQNKIISTGEGGVIITNDSEIEKKLRLIRSHGRSGEGYFTTPGSPDYTHLGYNFRMPTASAALGISQLSKIERIIDMRRQIADKYDRAFGSMSKITPPRELANCRHVYQLYSVMLDTHEQRDGLMKHLADNGTMSKVYFDPVHQTEHYRGIDGDTRGTLPVTEDVASRILTLPLYPGMPAAYTDRVIESVQDYLGE